MIASISAAQTLPLTQTDAPPSIHWIPYMNLSGIPHHV
jgi:hypothetical protein